jgi:hypothetical protein
MVYGYHTFLFAQLGFCCRIEAKERHRISFPAIQVLENHLMTMSLTSLWDPYGRSCGCAVAVLGMAVLVEGAGGLVDIDVATG